MALTQAGALVNPLMGSRQQSAQEPHDLELEPTQPALFPLQISIQTRRDGNGNHSGGHPQSLGFR